MSDDGAAAIQESAALILGRCLPPNSNNGQRTGLVVGHVQSGKTLSFTTVIALARDNGIPLVIVAAGTKNPLLAQTVDRLLSDLRVNGIPGPPRWLHIRNPDLTSRQTVEHAIEEWRDPTVPLAEKATLLLTVMKQHQRLENLNSLLQVLDLTGVPSLIIDDEADQASLNNRVNQNAESTTYQRLVALRRHLPCNSFLQYTATPQAPLLINIIDVLSPQFVKVLQPGDGYVGGDVIFAENRPYARVIPPGDIPAPNNPLGDPPGSLLEALRIFFVGVAAGLPTWGPANPNRSMLVHPSRTTDPHYQYFQAINAVVGEWRRMFTLPEIDRDRQDLLEDFHDAYRDLIATEPDLPEFAAIAANLPRALARTFIREVNTRGQRRTPEIEWNQAYAWILVGGQSMDRGFTVKELTVTYMPRGTGVGNADTLQQRARFFGYKRHYIGFCRVYLEVAVLNAFEAYVAHETQMREELQTLDDTGASLAGWKRRFVLDAALTPCRNNVISHDYVQSSYSDSWFHPAFVRMDETTIALNQADVDAFIQGAPFAADTSFRTTKTAQRHDVCDVPLRSLIDDLLLKYRVEDADDTSNLLGVLLQLGEWLKDHPDDTARVYNMRPRFAGNRTISAQGRITIGGLMQGRTDAADAYPGDRAFVDRARVTAQIHFTDLRVAGQRVRERVPILAVWVPADLDLTWVAQGGNR
ncbi:Z1 domain-containing protein [Hyphomicrobium sp. CS1GBMeth3]|uniref:Z1 domain-containing protein n=1 Tax=Hyphomicrobium sp. CS1GBMeth3 TaxID=1892845 RepID=UPI0015C52930|nr:Z1 domain-containing protein [Hyphomicrobium sp. CS1GBMeth3]